MFQDIVRRSATIDEIVVTTFYICTKMRPDGFWRQRDAHHRQRHPLSLHCRRA
ncbi:hypothetical protein [Nitrobacter hamburgensis]|uniref:hypothetical protein n=1 Tax=Nitrobacter hamburgensis TaxID=912 RepID=UPI00030E1F67|nr:hypothetical protein [Nitrobacter hamburgensis]